MKPAPKHKRRIRATITYTLDAGLYKSLNEEVNTFYCAMGESGRFMCGAQFELAKWGSGKRANTQGRAEKELPTNLININSTIKSPKKAKSKLSRHIDFGAFEQKNGGK